MPITAHLSTHWLHVNSTAVNMKPIPDSLLVEVANASSQMNPGTAAITAPDLRHKPGSYFQNYYVWRWRVVKNRHVRLVKGPPGASDGLK